MRHRLIRFDYGADRELQLHIAQLSHEAGGKYQKSFDHERVDGEKGEQRA